MAVKERGGKLIVIDARQRAVECRAGVRTMQSATQSSRQAIHYDNEHRPASWRDGHGLEDRSQRHGTRVGHRCGAETAPRGSHARDRTGGLERCRQDNFAAPSHPGVAGAGLSVSTVKHAHHSFDIDQPGKDSWEHRRAGADEVLVASAARWALMHELRDQAEPALPALLARMRPVDLFLVEGSSTSATRKSKSIAAQMASRRCIPATPRSSPSRPTPHCPGWRFRSIRSTTWQGSPNSQARAPCRSIASAGRRRPATRRRRWRNSPTTASPSAASCCRSTRRSGSSPRTCAASRKSSSSACTPPTAVCSRVTCSLPSICRHSPTRPSMVTRCASRI